MTNREWLNTLTDEEMAEILSIGGCIEEITDWLKAEHEEETK